MPGHVTDAGDPITATRIALKSLSRRILDLGGEITTLDELIEPLVRELAPQLLERTGISIEVAGQLLVTAGDNPDRLRSEAAFAMLCGTSPLPASSGKPSGTSQPRRRPASQQRPAPRRHQPHAHGTGNAGPAVAGPHRHFGHFPVAAGRLVNAVGIIEQNTWTKEAWTEPGDVADPQAAFDGWHPQVRAFLDAFDETFRWALCERAPMPRWSDGRVTLLGDACHAMLPFLAQGAAQAIEDGVILAALLSRAGSPAAVPQALRVYESVRQPRVTRVQCMAADNKVRLHLPDGSAQQARDAELASGATDIFFSAWDWHYRYDPEAVFARTAG